MKLIKFPESNIVYGAGQPEYSDAPAFVDSTGDAVFCWKLTLSERLKLLFTGLLWHYVRTHKKSLQPMHLTIAYPFTKKNTDEKS